MMRQRRTNGDESFPKKDKGLQTHQRDGTHGGSKAKYSKILQNTSILTVVFFIIIGSISIGTEGNVSRIIPVQIRPETSNKKLECTNSTDLNNCTNEQLVKTRNAVEKKVIEKADVCSVYLAPSSVPGGGMGMFTTKAVKKGGMVFPADG